MPLDAPEPLDTSPPRITRETVIIFRAAELEATDLGITAADRLPPGAGPYGCLYFVAAPSSSKRLFAAIPEGDVDHVDEGMLVAADVMSALVRRCDLSAFGETASSGFHASPAEGVERWLRAQDDLTVVPLTRLLAALDDARDADVALREDASSIPDRDLDMGRHHLDSLVRGDAVMGILSDVPKFIEQMMGALWRAAEAGDPRAFATLGECYFAVLVPLGAFDGVNPENDAERTFSETATTIEDEELPPLSYALRCWYEAATRGDRDALLRFANVSRTGPDPAKRLALELLSGLDDPSPKEMYTRALVLAWLGELGESAAAHTAAAERGDLDAAFELYIVYAQGLGVDADPTASRAWLDHAAAGDHPRALYNVAAEHATGNGRDKDPAKAAELYARAAELGNPRAAASLAYMILTGEHDGTPDEACEWLDLADQGGFDTAAMLEGAGLDDPRATSGG
jgi:hypothetical protein